MPSNVLLFLSVCLGVLIAPGSSLAMSEKKAAKIGREMYQQITSNMPIYQETGINKYLNRVGRLLVSNSDDLKRNYTFTIIDSPDINAFATPGAYIYINRGLLNFMNSEAQLAAVIAHEIAHVTEDHASRQKRAQTGSTVLSGIVTILTQSSEVGRASALWGAATVRGYGRDMELEADRVGAEMMQASGYNPQAMMEMIALLKDHERFSKKKARESGQAIQTYHGLFSTHPRNDQRLREVIKNAGGEETKGKRIDDAGVDNVPQFRIATNQLPWGENFDAQTATLSRFRHSRYRYQLDFPQGWEFEEKQNVLTAQSSDAAMTVERKQRTAATPEDFIKTTFGISQLSKAEALAQARLKGHTGIFRQANGIEQRVAVIYYGRGAYIFTGNNNESTKDTESGQRDKDFLAIIRSFRPYVSQRGQGTKTIHYVKATAGATYAKLARQLKLDTDGEDELRLINNAYPRGEPQAGQWIKIIR